MKDKTYPGSDYILHLSTFFSFFLSKTTYTLALQVQEFLILLGIHSFRTCKCKRFFFFRTFLSRSRLEFIYVAAKTQHATECKENITEKKQKKMVEMRVYSKEGREFSTGKLYPYYTVWRHSDDTKITTRYV